jgi:hypothetical protein
MFPFAPPLMLSGAGYTKAASYVTGGYRNDAPDTTTLNLAGASVGDYIVFVTPTSGATIAGGDGGWTAGGIAASITVRLLAKRLTAGDLVAGALTCGAYPWVFTVYRKPKGHNQAASGGSSSADLVLNGFTKDARSAGVVAAICATGPATPFTTPSGFTLRQSALVGGGFSYNFVGIYDLLSPGTYTNGASITFAPGGSKILAAVALDLLNSSSGAGAGPGGPFGSTDLSEDGNPSLQTIL